MKIVLNPWQKISRAANRGLGVYLTKEETAQLYMDDGAIRLKAAKAVAPANAVARVFYRNRECVVEFSR